MKKILSVILIFTMIFLAAFASCKKSKTGLENAESTPSDSINNHENNTDIDANELDPVNGNILNNGSSGGENSNFQGGNDNAAASGNGGTTNPKDYTDLDSNEITTRKHDESLATTNPEFTTSKEVPAVPKTDAKGKRVDFSDRDIQTLQYMLEMQGDAMSGSGYENSDGIPIHLACQIALFMSNGEQESPEGQVSLNLFTYFGQTVVNFKTKCNAANQGVTYVSSSETYRFSKSASSSSVYLDKFYDLEKDNFYKVTGTVTFSNKEKKDITVIIQKNKLDKKYGFSIKAQKLG